MSKPIMLVIMDGYGIAPPSNTNAISMASTPVLDSYYKTCPHTQLRASGEAVGLPEGQFGNSEVGHTNIGAGRIVYQDLSIIGHDIETGDFFKNEAYLGAMAHCKKYNTSLHLLGLISDGGVHSHLTHFWALLEMAKRQNVEKVYIHCFTDGRDTSPNSGIKMIRQCVSKCREIGIGKIATIVGRYYAMDRDDRWDRVKLAYDGMVAGIGEHNPDPIGAVQKSYDNGITDEFIRPVVCDTDGMIQKDDAIIFVNFRPDRAREITRTFVDPHFNYFERAKGFFKLYYVCTTMYDEKLSNVYVAYPQKPITNVFGEYISNLGLSQLRLAETEKYAHVTFFFNGGSETVYNFEDRLLILSPKDFPTYDMIPEMSANPLTQEALNAIYKDKYDVIIINYANCDMVGHTGNAAATIKAVETVDKCVGKIVSALMEMGGTALITSDHGNAEQLVGDDGFTPLTSHTANPVPFLLVGAKDGIELRDGGILADIAPTMLELMGLPQPEEMTGKSLIIKKGG